MLNKTNRGLYLPHDAYYTPEGAICIRRPPDQSTQALLDRIAALEEEINLLRATNGSVNSTQ